MLLYLNNVQRGFTIDLTFLHKTNSVSTGTCNCFGAFPKAMLKTDDSVCSLHGFFFLSITHDQLELSFSFPIFSVQSKLSERTLS